MLSPWHPIPAGEAVGDICSAASIRHASTARETRVRHPRHPRHSWHPRHSRRSRHTRHILSERYLGPGISPSREIGTHSRKICCLARHRFARIACACREIAGRERAAALVWAWQLAAEGMFHTRVAHLISAWRLGHGRAVWHLAAHSRIWRHSIHSTRSRIPYFKKLFRISLGDSSRLLEICR